MTGRHPVNASASQRVATATADLGKCRSKRESTTSGGGASEGGSESVGGRNVERGNEGGGREGGELQGENFVYLERRKEQKEARGESDKRRPHVELSVQGHDRSLPHTPLK